MNLIGYLTVVFKIPGTVDPLSERVASAELAQHFPLLPEAKYFLPWLAWMSAGVNGTGEIKEASMALAPLGQQ